MIEESLDVLKKVKLFKGISEEDIIKLTSCLNYKVKTFEKNSSIIRLGDRVETIGIVISGECEISKEDVSGNKIIVSILNSGNMFAESIVCRESKKSPVCVTALKESKIIFVSYENIIRSCSNKCEFHVRLINNLLLIVAEKNIILNNKIDILLLKGIRERVATFLLRMYKETGQTSFNIYLNRNQLAEYLNVCRSSLSRELSRMKDEGIIDYYKNSFKIIDLKALVDSRG